MRAEITNEELLLMQAKLYLLQHVQESARLLHRHLDNWDFRVMAAFNSPTRPPQWYIDNLGEALTALRDFEAGQQTQEKE